MRYLSVVVLFVHATLFTSPATAQAPKAPSLVLHGDPLPKGALARLGTVRFRPSGQVVAVALSPDGATLAIGPRYYKYGEMPVDLMDAASGKFLRKCEQANAVWAYPDGIQMQFTPTEKVLFTTKSIA